MAEPAKVERDHYIAMQIAQDVIEDPRAQALSLDAEEDRFRLRHLIFQKALSALKGSDDG